MINWKLLLTPFASVGYIHRNGGGTYGSREVFIFGIRIAYFTV